MQVRAPHPRRSLAVVFAAGLLSGCPTGEGDTPPQGDAGPTEDPRAVSYIEPVNPTGTVAGQILDAFTGGPLEGASVSLLHEASDSRRSATTGADGTFAIADVPSSAAIGLEVRKDGYTTAVTTVALPNAAGNLAQDNSVAFAGPIELLSLAPGASPTFRLFDPSGDQVVDASVTAQLDVRFVDDGQPFGSLSAGASFVASASAFVVSGLPDLQALAARFPQVAIRAAIAPGDGSLAPRVIELTAAEMFADGTVEVDLVSDVENPVAVDGGPTPEPDAEPVEPDSPLAVVGGNVADLVDPNELGLPAGDRPVLPSVLAPGDDIVLQLSRAIDLDTLFVSVVNQDGAGVPLGTISQSSSPLLGETELSISAAGLWPNGAELNVTVIALPDPVSAPVAGLSRQGNFLTTPDGNQLLLLSNGSLRNGGGNLACPDNAQTLRLFVNAPIGRRGPDGAPSIAQAALLPIRAQSGADEVSGPLRLDYTGGQAPITAEIFEDNNVAPASGYGFRIEVPISGALDNADYSGSLTIDLHLLLTFNDVAIADEVAGTGLGVVRGPDGAPLTSVEASVSVEARDGPSGPACVPPP